MLGKYNQSVILTYVGLMIALLGMCMTYGGQVKWGMICLVFAGICDLFDGKIARMCKRNEEEKQFGVQIDTLVDVISFLALPALLYMALFEKMHWVWQGIMLFYVLAGIIRLAWFNMHANSEGAMRYYEGLPVTYMALILPIVYVGYQLIEHIVRLEVVSMVYLVVGLLFILPIKIKKPGGIWYGIFFVLAIVVTSGLMYLA